MASLRKLFLQKVPDILQAKIIQSAVAVPQQSDSEFIFKIATEPEELEQAYKLLYSAYLKKGFISPNPRRSYKTLFHAHPLAVTFVGMRGREVVITMSLFPDSELGLPMDDLYEKELRPFRQQNLFLAEVGSFASARAYRKGSRYLPLMMNKLMHQYARTHLRIDHLMITVNPMHESVYKHLMLFERFGTPKPYDKVNGHIAVPMGLNLREAEKRMAKIYGSKRSKRNMYRFFCMDQYSNIRLPKEHQILTVYNQQLYNRFFAKQHIPASANSLSNQDYLLRLYRELEQLQYPLQIRDLIRLTQPLKTTL